MSWIDADRDLLRTMWARGSSSGDVAVALARPVSRNAVMGMVNRLGLMGLGHADDGRLSSMAKVSDLMQEEFSLGLPLHREALLALTVIRTGLRSVEGLAQSSGVCRPDCAAFIARLPLVWPGRASPPLRWQGGLEGNLAFILDMAVVAGRLSRSPIRGVAQDARPVRAARPSWSEPAACPAT